MALNYISYGGGVQSTAIVLLAIQGKIERPAFVVFSDTGSETPETYRTVQAIKKICQENDLHFETVKSKMQGHEEGIALHEYYQATDYHPYIPLVTNPRCTFNFKIYPVRRYVKTMVDKTQSKPWAYAMLGITTDESHRMRECELQWTQNTYPLIDLGWSRQDCIEFIEKEYPELTVQKSGCFCCPYQSPKTWIKLKKEHPDLFAIAREMEERAFDKGHKMGLSQGRKLVAYDYSHTLEDFGFQIESPDEIECGAVDGGCFL